MNLKCSGAMAAVAVVRPIKMRDTIRILSRTLTAGMLVALLAEQGWAPIFGFFPGLSKLIEHADCIVVAQLRDADPIGDVGGGTIRTIRVLAVLKGEVKVGAEARAYLRVLPFTTKPLKLHTLHPRGFRSGDRFVLFLNQNRDSKKEFEFQNENSSGDSFWIAPSSDLSKLKGAEARADIEFLLRDAVEYEKGQVRDYAQTVKTYLESE